MTDIVFLTTGCANSTVCVRMLQAMGWHLGVTRKDHAENIVVHRINTAIIDGKSFPSADAAHLLGSLPRPWCVKDPKFGETLPHWLPTFEPYRPLLLWVTKDMSYVRQSFRRKLEPWEPWPEGRAERCQSYFDAWPWSKLKIDVSQLDAAIKLYDPVRSTAQLDTK